MVFNWRVKQVYLLSFFGGVNKLNSYAINAADFHEINKTKDWLINNFWEKQKHMIDKDRFATVSI